MIERLRIGILHLNVRHGALAENRASLLAHAEEAAVKGARIIVAPELAVSGYGFNDREDVAPYVEAITGETVTGLSRIARRYGVYLCTGLAEREEGTGIFYNSAVVLGPDGKVAAHHRKHVAERRWSCPGQPSGKSLFETPWGKVGLLICADSYFGLLPRSLALQEADLFFICANWPLAGLDPREIWRARVLENGIGLIAANRTGLDQRMDCRTAPSYAVTPEGTVLLDVASEDTRIHMVEYPLERYRFPARLRGEMAAARRPGDYHGIALDASGLDDYSAMWGLPPAGSFAVRCLIPPPGPGSWSGLMARALTETDGAPGIILLPPSMGDLSLQDLIRLSEEHAMAVVAEVPSPSASSMPAFIAKGRPTFLPPDANAVMFDFAHARIALVRSGALRHPEEAVALSKQGCDLIVSQADTLDDDTRLLLGVKCLERSVVAVAAPDGATICEPPEGHERWQETVRKEPGICAVSIHTARTRKKRFLDRVDLGVLLRQ